MASAATNLDALRAVIDADRDATCDALGLRRDGNRWLCFCQLDGQHHRDGDLSTAAGFKCHKCDWKGDAFDLVQVVKGYDFHSAVEFLKGVYRVHGDEPRPAQARAPKKAPRTYSSAEDTAASIRPQGYDDTTVYHFTKAGEPYAAEIRFDSNTDKQIRQAKAVVDGWQASGPDGLWPLYMAEDLPTAGRVFVTEGGKAWSAGHRLVLRTTYSAGGANAAAKTDWAPMAGLDVVVLRDNDEQGEKYAATVAEQCHAVGVASVRVVLLPDLPHKGDLYDFAEMHRDKTADQIRAAIDALADAATPIETYTVPKDRRAETSPANGARGGRPSAPPAGQTAAEYARDRLTTLDEEYLTLRHHRGKWYRYANGWHSISDGEVRKAIYTYLQDRPDLAHYASTHYVNSVIGNLASYNLCGIESTQEMPCWLSTGEDARHCVAFSNGIAVDVWSYAQQLARGETPTDYTRTVSPDLFGADFVLYPWDEEATAPHFSSYIERVLPDPDTQRAIQQMLGILLADCGKWEVFWQLYGRGANGKTVLLDILEALVGRRNVCRVALESLGPDCRFQTFPLATCKVNMCGEMATNIGKAAYAAIEAALKHAVSGGTIEIERKGIDKAEERCRARFVMAGNSLPHFLDKSDAIWRRLRIIPFEVQIPEGERDPDLTARIIVDELPAIVLWALAGLAEVMQENAAADCNAGRKLKKAHRLDCDHERSFLQDHYTQGTNADRIPAKSVYDAYSAWMDINLFKALSPSRFYIRVEDLFPTSKKGAMRIEGQNKQGISGLKPLNVADVAAL